MLSSRSSRILGSWGAVFFGLRKRRLLQRSSTCRKALALTWFKVDPASFLMPPANAKDVSHKSISAGLLTLGVTSGLPVIRSESAGNGIDSHVHSHIPSAPTRRCLYTRGKVPLLFVQHQQGTFRARLFPVCVNLSVELRDGIALAPRQSAFRLASEIRHATNTFTGSPFHNPFEFKRCCDAASWHSTCSVKSVDVL
jgi:hypothetical protein